MYVCTSELQNNLERRFIHSVYTQASGSINFGDVNRTFKSTIPNMPLARPHSLPIYCIQLYVGGKTYSYAGIASAASPFGECIFGRCFWTWREWQGRRIFGGPKVRRQLKLNVTLLIIKTKLHLQSLPFRLHQLHHSNYYTACNFNRVCPPLSSSMHNIPTYLPTNIATVYSDRGRRQ